MSYLVSIFSKLLAISNSLCIKYSHVHPWWEIPLWYPNQYSYQEDPLHLLLLFPYWVHKRDSLLYVCLWYYISLLGKFVIRSKSFPIPILLPISWVIWSYQAHEISFFWLSGPSLIYENIGKHCFPNSHWIPEFILWVIF